MITDNRLLGFVVFILISAPFCLSELTVEEMRSNAKMLRDVCQPKFQVSDEIADAIRDGSIPNDDQNAKCYINCVLEMVHSIKNGKVDYDGAMKEIDSTVADAYRPVFRGGFDACRHSTDDIENQCDAAAMLLECLTTNIKEYRLP